MKLVLWLSSPMSVVQKRCEDSLLKPLCSDCCYFDVWFTCRYIGYTFYETTLQVLAFLFSSLNRNLGILFSPFIIYVTLGQDPFWLFKGIHCTFEGSFFVFCLL